MRYSRDLPLNPDPAAVLATEQHIRAHLSTVCTPDDDTERHAHEVRLEYAAHEGGVRITGVLDREPVADYLRDDFDPEADVTRNPLTVPSIEGGDER